MGFPYTKGTMENSSSLTPWVGLEGDAPVYICFSFMYNVFGVDGIALAIFYCTLINYTEIKFLILYILIHFISLKGL